MRIYTDQQTNISLCCIASTAWYQEEEDTKAVYDKLKKSLSLSPVTNGRFDNIVYGPATLRVKHNQGDKPYDDYMFYVVQQTENKNNYKLAIRSTTSTLNKDEDFNVFVLKPWSDYDPASPEEALIAAGMHEAIGDMVNMVSHNPPGNGLTVLEFFRKEIELLNDNEEINLTVCGHSFGGIVSPLMGLYLKNNINSDKIIVNVYSAAATTTGNSEYALYAESVLGNKLFRVANNKDVVTKPWSISGLEELRTIYEPYIKTSDDLISLIDGAEFLLKNKNYTHTEPFISFDPGINMSHLEFVDQAGYQHVYGYLEYYSLKMINLDDGEIPTDEDIVIYTSK